VIWHTRGYSEELVAFVGGRTGLGEGGRLDGAAGCEELQQVGRPQGVDAVGYGVSGLVIGTVSGIRRNLLSQH
jgi:hypothetical protein